MRKSKEFFGSAIRYTILLLTIIWVLRTPLILDFKISFRDSSIIDFSLFKWPLISLVSGFFLGRVAEQYLTGRWVQPIRNSLRAFGIIGSVYHVITFPGSLESLRFGSQTFLIGATVVVLMALGAETLGDTRRWIQYVLRSLIFVVAGYTSSRVISTVHEIGVEGLDTAFLVAGFGIALVSFTGLWEGDLNEYTSYIGKNWGNNLRRSSVLVFLVSVYSLVYRDTLIGDLGTGAGFVYLFEWGVVTGLGYLSYSSAVKSVSTFTNKKGKWKEHVQVLERRSEKGLDKWSLVVDDFIKKGDQSLLVVYLVELLRKNNVSLDRIRIELFELINWRDKEVPIGLVFGEEARRMKLREHRRMTVNSVIDRVQERIG